VLRTSPLQVGPDRKRYRVLPVKTVRIGKSGGVPYAIGLVAGVLSGLLGVGGGFLIVPAITGFLNVDQRVANGTSLLAVIPISLAAIVGYARAGEVQFFVATLLMAGGLVGAELGTRLLERLPVPALQVLFSLVLIVAALRLLVNANAAEGTMTLGLSRDIGLVLLGLATGLLSGLLGVGGGFIMVPGMLLLASMPSALARGTSLAAIIPTALYGSFRNASSGNLDVRLGLRIGLAGAISSAITAVAAVGLSPTIANRLLGALLIVLAVRTALQGGRGLASGPA
jgi:uncharacterized protein